MKSGKVIYYYRTYTPTGKRTVAKSTGQSSKTKAKIYCSQLMIKELLYQGENVLFRTFAEHFFDEGSDWYEDKLQCGIGKVQPISITTLKTYRHNLNNILLPYFGDMKIRDVSSAHIKAFRMDMVDRGFSNSAVNVACVCLKIILSYALAESLITKNPFETIKPLFTKGRVKEAFTLEELIKAFHNDWSNEFERKAFAITAALTGMRISEIMAIRKETLHEGYIDVKDQYFKGAFHPVKDGEKRKVCICDDLYKLLYSVMYTKVDNMVFSENQDTYRRVFYEKAGISQEERNERKLTFHSIRHFFNTYLVIKGISELKIKSIMGHSSGKGSMTERYTNFQPCHFSDVIEVQKELFDKFWN